MYTFSYRNVEIEKSNNGFTVKGNEHSSWFFEKFSELYAFLKSLTVVQVHAGKAHADDAMFVALTKVWAEKRGTYATYERVISPTFDTRKRLSQSRFIVGDIGLGHYDHHQATARRHSNTNSLIGTNIKFVCSLRSTARAVATIICVPDGGIRYKRKADIPAEWLTNPPKGCTFVHQGLFLASFDDVDDAIEAAKSLGRTYVWL